MIVLKDTKRHKALVLGQLETCAPAVVYIRTMQTWADRVFHFSVASGIGVEGDKMGFPEEAPLVPELEKEESELMEVEIEGRFPRPNHMKQKMISP